MNISLSNIGNTNFEKLLGHNPFVLESWINLEKTFYQHLSLDSILLEQVRRALAFENECEYCMLKAGKPCFSEKEKPIFVAVSFAIQFANNHKEITKEDFGALSTYFSEIQISELCSFICFITASQRFGRILNLS